jgi:hypothetical protein
MPARSKVQQAASGIAYDAKKKGKRLKPGTPSFQMAQGMDLGQLKEFASTPTGSLPKRKASKKRGPAPPNMKLTRRLPPL